MNFETDFESKMGIILQGKVFSGELLFLVCLFHSVQFAVLWSSNI